MYLDIEDFGKLSPSSARMILGMYIIIIIWVIIFSNN